MFEDDREIQGPANTRGDLAGVVAVVQRREQHHEFVPAQPADAVHGPNGAQEPPGEFAQHGISGGVPPGVVDLFEVIEVGEDQRKLLSGALGGGQGLGETIDEQIAVGQTSQGVVRRLLSQRGLGEFKFVHLLGLFAPETIYLQFLSVLLGQISERDAKQMLGLDVQP